MQCHANAIHAVTAAAVPVGVDLLVFDEMSVDEVSAVLETWDISSPIVYGWPFHTMMEQTPSQQQPPMSVVTVETPSMIPTSPVSETHHSSLTR